MAEQVFKADLSRSLLVFGDAKGLIGTGICSIVTVFSYVHCSVVGCCTRVWKGFNRAFLPLRFNDSLLKEALPCLEGVRSEVLYFALLNRLSMDGFRWGHSSGVLMSVALDGEGKKTVKGLIFPF